MSQQNRQDQDTNTAKLVMSAFYKIMGKDGATAEDVTKYLQHKFGDVWRMGILTKKAEQTLKRSAALGFLDKRGKKYIEKLAREVRRDKRKRKSRRSWFRLRRKQQRRRRRRSCCCS